MPPSCFGGICKLSKVRISDFGRPGLLVLRFRRIMRDHKNLNTSRVNTELRWALPTRSEDPRPLPRPAPPSTPRWRWCSSVRASLVSAVWPNERFDMFVQTPIASRSRTAAVAALRFASTSRRSAKSLSYLHISRRGRIGGS